MGIDRRQFLAAAGAFGSGGALNFLGSDLGIDTSGPESYASEKIAALQRSRITTTICPYCACGCGALVMAERQHGRKVVINIEGDPDHPINEGTLCPKGAALYQMANNEKRLDKVLYRAKGAKEFVEKSWTWAAQEIAKRIKKTRDEMFTARNANGEVVNRTTGIASVGSAAIDNEECWLYQKMLRAMGLVYIEHQARI